MGRAAVGLGTHWSDVHVGTLCGPRAKAKQSIALWN